MTKQTVLPEEGWARARLIPVTGIGGAAEQEGRATSALLAVMQAVPSFGKAVLSYLDAPAGTIASFAEVQLKDEKGKVSIPDGAIVVTRGKTRWVCLVEVKTGKNELDSEQINRYLALANLHNFDAVLTISNQLVSSPDATPVDVDRRRLRRLTLRHLSWLRILTEAVNEFEHRGVSDPEQAWILGELIAYLDHEKSGAAGFEGMGPSWVAVRDAARQGTLRASDAGVREVAHDWQEFIEYLCLGLRQNLGGDVSPIYPRSMDAKARLAAHTQSLGTDGRLEASIRVPDTVGPIDIEASLASRLVTTSTRVTAPKEGRPKTRINWLLRQLKNAPEDLRVTVRFSRTRETTSLLLPAALEAPDALLLPQDPKREPSSFDVALARELGTKRGRGRGSFVAATRGQVLVFYRDVVQDIQPWTPRAPKLRKDSAAVFEDSAEDAGTDYQGGSVASAPESESPSDVV